MEMDRTTLLRCVNARSERRFGERLSGSMLDDLVEEWVISGAERRPSEEPRPNYRYDESALRTLVRVRWLKARGLHRYSELRLYLWLAHFEVPFELVLSDLQNEFSRVARRMLRPISSVFDPTKSAATERDIRTLNRQLGRVDPRLLPGQQTLDPEGLVDAYSLMRFGRAERFDDRVVTDLMKKLGFPVDRFGAELPAFIRESLRHFLAAADESEAAIAGLIPEFDESTCQRARAILNEYPWLMTKGMPIARELGLSWVPDPTIVGPHFELSARALFQPEFRIATFVQLAMGVRQGCTEGIFDPSFIRIIRDIRDRGSRWDMNVSPLS